MAKIAVRYPVEAAAVQASRPFALRDATRQACEPDEARSLFLADLAERIAAVCAEADDTPCAVPLPREADSQVHYVRPVPYPPQPAGGAWPSELEAEGIKLFTADGKHLRTLDDIEADILRLALSHYRGRISEVARRLAIGRSTVYRKLGEFGIAHSGR